jgi:transcriptional regulator with XRE-family HTH domain
MKPARRSAVTPLSDHPAVWTAAARDAARQSTACPKCQGHVEVSYDPGSRQGRSYPTGARHRMQPDEVLDVALGEAHLEMSAPVEDSPFKGFLKGPDTTVTVQAVDLEREEDRLPQRRIFRRCWNCGWGELLWPEPRTDASLGNHASPVPDLPWRVRGRVFLHLEQRWVSREQLAVKAGISPSYLHEVLAGTKRASTQAVERLAAAAGLDPRKVLGSTPASTGRDWLGFLEAQATGILDSDTDAARTGLVTGRTERVRLPTRPRRRQPATIYTAPGEPPVVLMTRAAQRGWALNLVPAPVAAHELPPETLGCAAPLWRIEDESSMPKPWDSIQLDQVRRYLDARSARLVKRRPGCERA